MNPWSKTSIEERLSACSRLIPQTGCREWTRSTNGRYGILHYVRRWYAHRLAWSLANGIVPESNLQVCHRCDNPLCINGEHLFLGTGTDNMRDCVRKGRIQNQKGAHNNKAKLSDSDVTAIRELHATSDATFASTARRYGVYPSVISRIVHCKTWKHLCS